MSVVNEERNYTVYMHVNKENGKVYVGITSTTVEVRWGSNGCGYRNQLFGKAIQKYGWNNFEHIILSENKTKEVAEELEILYIKVLMSNNKKFGYNLASGGGINCGYKLSVERRKEMSKSRIGTFKGKDNPQSKKVYCGNMTFESINEFSNYYKLNPNNVYNWIKRKTIPDIFIDLHFYIDEDFDNFQNYNALKCTNIGKRVYCDNIIFESISECAKYFNESDGSIRYWLNYKMPSKYFKLGLKYFDDDVTHQIQEKFYPTNSIKVICGNKLFLSINDCSSYYNVNAETIRRYLTGTRKTPQKYIDLGLRYYNPEADGDIEQYEQYIAS